jgi:hypothetical protein
MTDDNMQPKVDDRPEQAKPEQVRQQTQQSSHASDAAEPSQRVAHGRRPLFRN